MTTTRKEEILERESTKVRLFPQRPTASVTVHPSFQSDCDCIVLMRVTPYTPDDGDTVSESQHSMDEGSALMVVTRQPFDIALQDPTDSPPVSLLPPDPPPTLCIFKDDKDNEPLEFDPTISSLGDRMKQFFEGEDTWGDNDPYNCYYFADGALPFLLPTSPAKVGRP